MTTFRTATKITALLLAIIMVLLAAYTIVIGVRLFYYSWIVEDSSAYVGGSFADETYNEASEGRKALQNESWYANVIYNANNFTRLVILVVELASIFTNAMLYGLVKSYEPKKVRR